MDYRNLMYVYDLFACDYIIIIIIVINPLTVRVVGAPQMILQPCDCTWGGTSVYSFIRRTFVGYRVCAE